MKMGRKEKREKAEIHLISGCLRLISKNVPALIVWQHKGQLKKFGTSNMAEWFDNLDEDTKLQLSSDMVLDMKNLVGKEEELIQNPENFPLSARASSIFKSLTNPSHASGLPELPFPLTLMSKKQKVKYLSDQIASEAKKDKARVVYGSENWRPSLWLESDWSWVNLKQPLSKTKETMYTGEGNLSEFFSKTIRKLFEKKVLDPEMHVVDLQNKGKILEQKRRFRGIHSKPRIISGPSHNNNPETDCQRRNQHLKFYLRLKIFIWHLLRTIIIIIPNLIYRRQNHHLRF